MQTVNFMIHTKIHNGERHIDSSRHAEISSAHMDANTFSVSMTRGQAPVVTRWDMAARQWTEHTLTDTEVQRVVQLTRKLWQNI